MLTIFFIGTTISKNIGESYNAELTFNIELHVHVL